MNQLIEPPSTSLPSAWIDRLFERFEATYGNKFADMWRGMDAMDVKGVWAAELTGYTGAEIKVGLSLLRARHPSWPPTLYEFMALCRANVAQEAHKALPWPEVDKSEVAPQIANLQAKLKSTPRLAWAEKIKERHAAGDKTLWPIAVKMANDAERIAAGGVVRS